VKKRVVIVLGVVLVAVAGDVGYALFLVPCSGFWVCPDTPQLAALEERELMPLLREVFRVDQAVPREFRLIVRYPEPLRVRVKQKEATLTAKGPIYPELLQYAAAWYDVYSRHHPGTGTVVYLNVVWPSGSLKLDYPPTTLRAPPPRDVRDRVATTN
jgi:hypothetical protein